MFQKMISVLFLHMKIFFTMKKSNYSMCVFVKLFVEVHIMCWYGSYLPLATYFTAENKPN